MFFFKLLDFTPLCSSHFTESALASHQCAAAMSLRVVVASRFQDKLSKTESNPDHKWKDIIASFPAAQGISEHGLSFWVGDCEVVPENLVSSSSAGDLGLVFVSAQTESQERLNALGDSLRRHCECAYDGSTSACFDNVAGSDEMT